MLRYRLDFSKLFFFCETIQFVYLFSIFLKMLFKYIGMKVGNNPMNTLNCNENENIDMKDSMPQISIFSLCVSI